jgi:Mce-associated membrane protein
MEGDAGANRLNTSDTDDSSTSDVKSKDASTEVTAEDSVESEVGTDQTSTAEIGTEQIDTADEADQTSTETTAEDESEAGVDDGTDTVAEPVTESGDAAAVADNPSRLGRRWLIGITAALLLMAGGVAAGGYFALRANQESQTIARHDAQAVQIAKDCVAATQAPDPAAMAAGVQKIIDCSAGDFRSQAILYSSLFVEAYQAGDVHVEVSDMRAAPERSNPDGSVDVLVAFRIKTSNSETQNREVGYRLRVKMALSEGQYRIAKLDQVAK